MSCLDSLSKKSIHSPVPRLNFKTLCVTTLSKRLGPNFSGSKPSLRMFSGNF